jgi:hypothetical protein
MTMAKKDDKPHFKQVDLDLYEDEDGNQFTGAQSEIIEAEADGRVTKMTKAEAKKAEKAA